MVGVPRSLGCLLCVRRRVRCDLARPGCAKCLAYGAECPGYERMAKFVASKHEVRRRGESSANKKSLVLRRADARDRIRNRVRGEVDQDADLEEVSESSSTWLSRRSSPAILPQVSKNRAAFISTMLDILSFDRRPTEIVIWGTWFDHVPRRLGVKATLDSAVCAFAMHLLGKTRRDNTLVIKSRELYGQSLMILQRALEHPTEWRSSETLCACMVMCLYELFADTTSTTTSWVKHAQGVTRLLQQRGVDGYADLWDRSMLFSFRTIIIMSALEGGHDCFLAKKKWQRVMNNLDNLPSPTVAIFPRGGSTVVNRLIILLSRLPPVLRGAWTIRRQRLAGLPVDPVQVSLLQRAASSLHNAYCEWLDRAQDFLGDPIYYEVPTDPALVETGGPASPYPTVLCYNNTWVGTIYLMYLTSVTIVQEALNQCAAVRYEAVQAARAPNETKDPPPRPFDENNRSLCRIIYRSFENLGRGLLGQYRVGFSMRMAYEFADLPTQLWIIALLNHASKVYASSRADSYPSPAPNEFGYN